MTTARTLLIADDSSSMRDMIRRTCAGPDDRILEAANGEEAVTAFSLHQPDWAVMDIKMPVMDGLHATRAIRREFPRARIVIVTESDDPIWKNEALAAGAEVFLLKDDLTKLRAIVNASPIRDRDGTVAGEQNE